MPLENDSNNNPSFVILYTFLKSSKGSGTTKKELVAHHSLGSRYNLLPLI